MLFVGEWYMPYSTVIERETFQKPPNSGSEFFCYKGRYSMILMAVVGHDYKFIYANVGAPGKHSGEIWYLLHSWFLTMINTVVDNPFRNFRFFVSCLHLYRFSGFRFVRVHQIQLRLKYGESWLSPARFACPWYRLSTSARHHRGWGIPPQTAYIKAVQWICAEERDAWREVCHARLQLPPQQVLLISYTQDSGTYSFINFLAHVERHVYVTYVLE